MIFFYLILTSATRYYSKDGINYEESTNSKFQFTDEYEYGVATTMLTNFERNQIKKVYLKVEDEIGNISDIKEISITETDFAYDETVDHNLRYIGANPNNYVLFNNELWRIIGVMNNIDDGTGKNETRIKLIRNESIGEYSWDTSSSTVNNGWGVNEWSQADSMKLMNPGYDGLSVGGSLYWNRRSGNCYIDKSNATSICDFTSTGLLDSAKLLIGEAVWNTGAAVTGSNILTSKFYELERSITSGKICTSGTSCNDTVTRKLNWTGYVGLMYPSDYGYATKGGFTTSRANCLDTVLAVWNDSNISDCASNDWLNKLNVYQLTLSPASHSSYGCHFFHVGHAGRVYDGDAFYKGALLPTLYLKANVKITNGIGSELSPFELTLE